MADFFGNIAVQIVGGLAVLGLAGLLGGLWRRLRGRPRPGPKPIPVIAGADIETMPYEGSLANAQAEVRSHFAKGRELQRREQHKGAIAEFEKAFEAAQDDSERSALHILIGNSSLQLSRIREAEGRYGEALTAADAADDSKAKAVALANLGIVHGRRGEFEDAIQDYQSSLALYDPSRDQLERAITLGDLAIVLVDKGQTEKAEQHHKEALAILGNMQGPVCEVRVANQLGRLGYLYAQRRQVDQAGCCYRKSLSIHKANGYRLGQANQLGGLASISAERGALLQADAHDQQAREQYKKAEEQYKKARTILEDLKNPIGQARQLGGLGDLYASMDRFDDAERSYHDALRIHERIGNPIGQAMDLKGLGLLAEKSGHPGRARQLLERAQDLYDAIGAGGPGPETIRSALPRLDAATHRGRRGRDNRGGSAVMAVPWLSWIPAALRWLSGKIRGRPSGQATTPPKPKRPRKKPPPKKP